MAKTLTMRDHDYAAYRAVVKQKQHEIAKAYIDKDFANVRRLQQQLVRMYEARVLAVCPVCCEPITSDDLASSAVEKHHKLARVDGGSDNYTNLVLLHQHCHSQITYASNPKTRAVWKACGIITEKPEKE